MKMNDTSVYEKNDRLPAYSRQMNLIDDNTRIPLLPNESSFVISLEESKPSNFISYNRINFSNKALRSTYRKINQHLGE